MAQRKKSKKEQEDVLIDISEVTGQAEDVFEKYQKEILIGVVALVVIVGGWLAFKNFYAKPRQKEAVEQMAQAEWQFQRDSFNLALANPGGGFPGFAEIVKKYSGKTLLEYGQDIYLEEARRLLLDTDMSISDIITELGFSNRSHFYRVFRRAFGETPLDYRNRQ